MCDDEPRRRLPDRESVEIHARRILIENIPGVSTVGHDPDLHLLHRRILVVFDRANKVGPDDLSVGTVLPDPGHLVGQGGIAGEEECREEQQMSVPVVVHA